jgi:ribosomal-protein-alanine N-acetyltransferase
MTTDHSLSASQRPEGSRRGDQPPLRVHIRWMIRRDMPEVLQIERESFEFPWFEEEFIRCLRQRNCIGMVAEHAERVVGFMIYELHKTRLHILNFAVAGDVRRRGVGRQMIEKLISKLSSQRRTRITLEVRETNLAAQVFFRAHGFRATSVLHDFYDDSPEDAYLMQYCCDQGEADSILPLNRIDRLAG